MNDIREVKNNHDAILNVAGVEIKPKKTAGIEADALRNCLGSNAIKQWIKLKLIEIEGFDELSSGTPATSENVTAGLENSALIPGIPGIPGAPTLEQQRAALEAKATELGVQGVVSRMKDETLRDKIAEIETAPGN